MKKLLLLSLVVLSVIIAPMSNVFAEGAKTISFQGVLLDSDGNPLNDVLPVRFELYDAQYGGNQLWGETQSVEFEDGYFNVYLGTENPLDLEFKSDYYLQITVADGTPYDRTPLSYTPYAFSSETAKLADLAQDIPDGSVTLAKLADEVKIITGDVEGTLPELYLADGAVKRNIKPGDIETWMLSENVSVPPSGPASGDLTGTYPDPKLADEAVTTRTIETGAITWSKLQTPLNTTPGTILGWDGTKWVETDVPTWEIGKVKDVIDGRGLYREEDADGFMNIGIADDGIVSSMILDGEVMTEDLADMSVTNAKLATDAVTTDKIMDGEVMTDDIADMNVTNAKLAADAVTTDKIMDGEVMTSDIADLNVTNAKIATDAITTDKIMDGEVMNEDLAPGAVDLTKLADGTEMGQVIYWDGTEWRYNEGAPYRDQILKWDWNADTTNMELQWQQDAMSIPFYYGDESTDVNGDEVTMFTLEKNNGNPNAYDNILELIVNHEDANSALVAAGSGVDSPNSTNHEVATIFGESDLGFKNGVMGVIAEVTSLDLNDPNSASVAGLFVHETNGLDNGYKSGAVAGFTFVEEASAGTHHTGLFGEVEIENGGGHAKGVIGQAWSNASDVNVGVLGTSKEAQNVSIGVAGVNNAAWTFFDDMFAAGQTYEDANSIGVLAYNGNVTDEDVALFALAEGEATAAAIVAENAPAIEAMNNSVSPTIAAMNEAGPVFDGAGDVEGSDYVAMIENINADGRGMLIESTSPTAFPYNWPGDLTDADDATLVVRNNATAPRIALKTYGDIVANSAVYASMFVANDSIVIGEPGNQVVIKAPENPGDPLTFGGDVDIEGTLDVDEDIIAGGMVMAPTGDFEILNVSDAINASTATADFGVTSTDELTANGYFSANDGAGITGGLVVDDVQVNGYASQVNAPVEDDDLTNKLYVDTQDGLINDRIDDILNVGATFAGTYDLSGTMNVSGTIQPNGGTVLANSYEPTADIAAANAEFGGDLYVEGEAGILDDGMGGYVFSVANDPMSGTNAVLVDGELAVLGDSYMIGDVIAMGDIEVQLGNVINPIAPTSDDHLTNKLYVDNADNALQAAIDQEILDRTAGDVAINDRIDDILTVGADLDGTYTVNGLLQPGTGTVRANDYEATADLTANTIIGNSGEFGDLTVTDNAYLGGDASSALITVDATLGATTLDGNVFSINHINVLTPMTSADAPTALTPKAYVDAEIAGVGADVTALELRVAQNETDITAIDGRVTQNETDITAIDGRVTQNETDITAIDGRVTQNETDITAIDGRVTQNETDITAIDGRVTQNETDITAIDGRVTQNETDITALDGRVTQNETDIDANETAIATEVTDRTNADNAIIGGAGLDTDGSYIVNGTANYISGATSLSDADDKLDAALKAVADDVDAISAIDPITFDGTNIGLNHDATLAVAGGNLGINLANANTWTANQTFPTAYATNFETTNGNFKLSQSTSDDVPWANAINTNTGNAVMELGYGTDGASADAEYGISFNDAATGNLRAGMGYNLGNWSVGVVNDGNDMAGVMTDGTDDNMTLAIMKDGAYTFNADIDGNVDAGSLTFGTNVVNAITTTVDASSTDAQLPTAKATWDAIDDVANNLNLQDVYEGGNAIALNANGNVQISADNTYAGTNAVDLSMTKDAEGTHSTFDVTLDGLSIDDTDNADAVSAIMGAAFETPDNGSDYQNIAAGGAVLNGNTPISYGYLGLQEVVGASVANYAGYFVNNGTEGDDIAVKIDQNYYGSGLVVTTNYTGAIGGAAGSTINGVNKAVKGSAGSFNNLSEDNESPALVGATAGDNGSGILATDNGLNSTALEVIGGGTAIGRNSAITVTTTDDVNGVAVEAITESQQPTIYVEQTGIGNGLSVTTSATTARTANFRNTGATGGTVGIQNEDDTNPTSALDVVQAGTGEGIRVDAANNALTINQGSVVLSTTTVAVDAIVADDLNYNVIVITYDTDNGYALPAGTNGQIVYVINAAATANHVVDGQILNNGETAMFIYADAQWFKLN